MIRDRNGKEVKMGDTVLIRATINRINPLPQCELVSVNLPHSNGYGYLTLDVEPGSVELISSGIQNKRDKET